MVKRFAGLVVLLCSVTGAAASAVEGSVEALIEQSVEGLKAQTSVHGSTWHFGKEQSWSVDQDRGVIEFRFAEGIVATAPVQIVGTYNRNKGSFLWGWDNPSVDEALRRAASRVRAYGVKNNVPAFTQREVKCSEAEAWEFTAVAARLDSASGAYRATTSGPLVYMTFGEVKLEKRP